MRPAPETRSPATAATVHRAYAQMQPERTNFCHDDCGSASCQTRSASISTWSPVLRSAKLRGAELARLAEHRRHERRDLGACGLVARLVAEVVVALATDPDLDHFERRARAIGVRIDPDVAVAEIRATEARRDQQGARWRLTSAIRAGCLLALTRDERSALRITTIEAIDEAPEARRERVRAARLDREMRRRRQKRAQAKKIRDDTRAAEVAAVHCQNMEAQPSSKEKESSRCLRGLAEKPWELLNLSERTYYRRRAEARALAAAAAQAEPAKGDGDAVQPATADAVPSCIAALPTVRSTGATPQPGAAASGERGEAEGPNLSAAPPTAGRRVPPRSADAADTLRAHAQAAWDREVARYCGAPESDPVQEIAA